MMLIALFIIELSSLVSQGRDYVDIVRTTNTKTITANNIVHLRRWSLALLSIDQFYWHSQSNEIETADENHTILPLLRLCSPTSVAFSVYTSPLFSHYAKT